MSNGFSEEELNALQEEAEKEALVEKEAEASEALLAEQKAVEEAKKTTEEGEKKEEGIKDGQKEEDRKEDEERKVDSEDVKHLRESLRTQKEELTRLSEENKKFNEILKRDGIITEEDEKKVAEQDKVLQQTYAERSARLEEMLEIMRLNPTFQDIDEVVSQDNFEAMVEAMAKFIVGKDGGSLPDVIANVTKEVWGMVNPYRYMYGMIKQYHPNYVKVEVGKEPEVKVKIDEKLPEKAATSLQNIPGAGAGFKDAGWTSARIDAMDEAELHTVPKDIYSKYMMNELK